MSVIKLRNYVKLLQFLHEKDYFRLASSSIKSNIKAYFKMSNKRLRGPGPVPARWLQCPRKGADTIVGKFIPCKTPLSSAFDEQMSQECRFPPSMLFDICNSKKIKIGMWIDLTNTNRFYNKGDVENHECKYIKLSCRGHGETPSKEQTKAFIEVVHNFISKYPLDCIAVHCTHGFNRTGFLIISYLIERMDCSLEVALDIFAKARPPGIYKADYLKELYRRYDDIDDAPPPPQLPDWCKEDEDAEDEYDDSELPGYTERPSSSQNGAQKPPKKKFKADTGNKIPEFMKGVTGVTHFTDYPKDFELQRKVQRFCGWKTKGFPGSQPVSMDKNKLALLKTKPYRVSWKADGTRYMMLIDGYNEVYFFDRDHCIFKVKGLTFPYRNEKKRHLQNTLLDGEMVIDKFNGTSIPRYLVYDIIKFEMQDVGSTPFYPTRLSCIENEIIRPRNSAIENGLINKAAEPFSIRKKEFWHITQAASLLGEKFAKTLSHEPDGLIFQPSKEPYTPGRCEDVLKWKPPELNSVDFKLRLVTEGGVGIIPKKMGHLYVGQLNIPFATMKYTSNMKELDNKIIECKFVDNQWKFMRIRTDKSFPNAHSTAAAVYESIRNPVTKEKLLNYIQHDRFDDDCEIMPPPKTS